MQPNSEQNWCRINKFAPHLMIVRKISQIGLTRARLLPHKFVLIPQVRPGVLLHKGSVLRVQQEGGHVRDGCPPTGLRLQDGLHGGGARREGAGWSRGRVAAPARLWRGQDQVPVRKSEQRRLRGGHHSLIHNM